MASRPTERLVLGRLVEPDQIDLLGGGADLVREALAPGRPTVRSGKVWHIGDVFEQDGLFYARLGFGAPVRVVQWHEQEKTFQRTSFDGGIAAPFLIRMSDLAIAYQPRKQDIRADTFVATLREMLKYGRDGADWRVESPTGRILSFDAWRGEVARITRLRFRFERADRARTPLASATIEALLRSSPDRAAIEWWADGGLDADDALIREFHDHVVAGFGEMTADGRRDDTTSVIRQWTSKTGEETIVFEVEVGDDDDEVSRKTLAEHLQFVDQFG
jgi:hypothetical protein